ncbi:MAG: SMC family ATPase [Chitinophagales bacterium]|nr:SMC family ATPase [Chitinophagales bacterium]
MLPLKLTIEGLYSYKAAQTIDFNRLTEAGLFGIFGTTGSGKSSILEAISFVLYGDIERMNSRENRAYNMMNLASDRLFIELDFLNYERKTFRINREYKRNKKKFDTILSPIVATYEWIDEHWIPTNKTAEEILGISYDNFKRTIIIPQGQFREFLDLKDTARTQMMKEIFGLDRYDLQYKAQELRNKSLEQANILQGALSSYSEVTTEAIEAQRKRLMDESLVMDATKKEYETVQDNYHSLKKLKSDFDDLKIKTAELQAKVAQEAEHNQRQTRLETFEKVSRILRPLFVEKRKLQDGIAKINSELKGVFALLESRKASLLQAESKKQTLTPQFEALPTKRQEISDLKIIEIVFENVAKYHDLSGRIEKGKVMVAAIQKELEQNRTSILDKDSAIQQLQAQRMDTGLLIAIGEWYSTSKNLNALRLQKEAEIQKIKIEIEKEQESLNQRKIQPSDWKIVFEGQEKQLQEQKATLNEKINSLEVQQKLAHYSHELHDGMPCPLCGSEHHPNISIIEDVTDTLKDIKIQIQTIDTELKTLDHTKSEVGRIIQRLEMLEQHLYKEKTDYTSLSEAINTHQDTFSWNEFDKTDASLFETKRQQSQDVENQMEQQQKSLRTLREKAEELSGNEKKYTSLLNDYLQQQSNIAAEMKANESHLVLLKVEDYKDLSGKEIKEKYTSLETFVQTIEQEYNTVSNQINDLKPNVAAQTTLLETYHHQHEQASNDAKKVDGEIQQQCILLHIEADEAQQLINQDLDIEKERKIIHDFRVALEVLKEKVAGIKAKLQDAAYDEASWLQIEKQYQALKEKLDIYTQQTAQIQGEIKRLEASYHKKMELTKEYEQVEHRTNNLQTLYNLFKGSAFVNYVSSVYLRQLCQHANVRFRQMTHNSLILDLNENNEFEIIDNLNEGRTRSIKTLSGGQAFQVSLSLALALAERVQSRSGTERNFFFIDEGFGTQDNQSVNIVFETLLSLNREKKVVGIISHVDELKDRIPISITVNNDHERGSIISWS